MRLLNSQDSPILPRLTSPRLLFKLEMPRRQRLKDTDFGSAIFIADTKKAIIRAE